MRYLNLVGRGLAASLVAVFVIAVVAAISYLANKLFYSVYNHFGQNGAISLVILSFFLLVFFIIDTANNISRNKK